MTVTHADDKSIPTKLHLKKILKNGVNWVNIHVD